jgi:hypothetical protein
MAGGLTMDARSNEPGLDTPQMLQRFGLPRPSVCKAKPGPRPFPFERFYRRCVSNRLRRQRRSSINHGGGKRRVLFHISLLPVETRQWSP